MTHFDPQRGAGLHDFSDEPTGTNILGIIGFILSILCVTAPLGLIISLIALYKRPRGFAVAGAIIGILFTAVMGVAIWGLFNLTKYSTGVAVTGGIAVDHEIIRRQAGRYHAETNTWPTDLGQINLPADALVDPWGNPYRYEIVNSNWTITTPGPDGTFGNDDDFTIGRDEEFENNERVGQHFLKYWVATDPGITETVEAWKAFSKEVQSLEQWQQANAGMSAVKGGGPLDQDDEDATGTNTDETAEESK